MPTARDGFTLVVHPLDQAVQVTADPAAIERILFNWVDNACKYAARATDRRLEIRPLVRGPVVVLRLTDHGPGVPPEDRRRIFRPFHKSAARAAATAPGVGLGLALSRRLARSQGGDLRLGEETEPQVEGAVFELLLRFSRGAVTAPRKDL
jgi:C4-dicarboxylate-specific signal transduction histidine kinase